MVAERKASSKRGFHAVVHEALDPSAVPWARLFELEERIDWHAVNAEIVAGRSVRISSVNVEDVEHVAACALQELGRQNIYVDDLPLGSSPLRDLYIFPRALLGGLLLERFDRVYT